MKKILLTSICLVAIGLFSGSQEVSANESVLGMSRGLPAAYQKATIESGRYKEIKVGSLRTDYFVSKYVIKFKVYSEQKEAVLLDEMYDHGYNWQSNHSKYFFTNSTETIQKTLLDETVKGGTNGHRVFRLHNYSPKSIEVAFAVNSSIQPRDIPCIDYSDIDFDL